MILKRQILFFVSILFPDASTQIMFNDSIRISFTFSFDSWSTDRKTVDTRLENQIKIGNAQNIDSPKYLRVALQTAASRGVANNANNVAVFDNLYVWIHHVEIDGIVFQETILVSNMKQKFMLINIEILIFLKKNMSEKNYLIVLEVILIWKTNIPFKSLIYDFKLILLIQRKFNSIRNIKVLLIRIDFLMILFSHRKTKFLLDGNKFTEVNNWIKWVYLN